MDYKRLSEDIVELFEKLLIKHNIIIPDEDREQDDNACAIYGCTYAELCDQVKEKIADAVYELLRDFHKDTSSFLESDRITKARALYFINRLDDELYFACENALVKE